MFDTESLQSLVLFMPPQLSLFLKRELTQVNRVGIKEKEAQQKAVNLAEDINIKEGTLPQVSIENRHGLDAALQILWFIVGKTL